MDSELQESKETVEGNIGLQRKDYQKVYHSKKGKKEKPGRKQDERAPKIIDADQLKITVCHFFGNKLNAWIDEIYDPGLKEQCIYSSRHLIWLGLMMFILRLGSRRQLTNEKDTSYFLANLLELSATSEETVAHSDTLNYAMERIDPSQIEAVKVKMVKQLIKDRRLEEFRLLGDFRIAVDATGLFSFDEQHCDNCLKTVHSNGKITWSHKMLEAKLVSENGFAMSVCSEPIENSGDTYTKQDCELKAFYRLSERLKSNFPRTPICLLMDGLYACQEVFRICKKNNWSFIIVFKEGSIPNLYSEVAKKKAATKNLITIPIDKDTEQSLSWVHSLNYEGFNLNAISCKDISRKAKVKSEWLWLTNRRPTADNVYELVNKGGRQRWKIENQGFLEQKRHGFELEHLYGEDPNAWKNYYQLMQIAHIITQLIIYGDLCQKLQTLTSEGKTSKNLPFRKYYQSVRNFVRRLAESFRNSRFSELCLIENIQIRFSSA